MMVSICPMHSLWMTTLSSSQGSFLLAKYMGRASPSYGFARATTGSFEVTCLEFRDSTLKPHWELLLRDKSCMTQQKARKRSRMGTWQLLVCRTIAAIHSKCCFGVPWLF